MQEPTTQLPMGIPAVARWYDDVERHTQSGRCTNSYDDCPGCRRLRDRMADLRKKHADKLVTL